MGRRFQHHHVADGSVNLVAPVGHLRYICPMSLSQTFDRGRDAVGHGRDPRQMTPDELHALSHDGQLLRAVRHRWLECRGDNVFEVRRCGVVWCALWPYRMGTYSFARTR